MSTFFAWDNIAWIDVYLSVIKIDLLCIKL